MNTIEIKNLINKKAQKAENDFNGKLQGIIEDWTDHSNHILERLENEKSAVLSGIQQQLIQTTEAFEERISKFTALTNQYVDSSQSLKVLMNDEIKAMQAALKSQNESILKLEEALETSIKATNFQHSEVNNKLFELRQHIMDLSEKISSDVLAKHTTLLDALEKIHKQSQDNLASLTKTAAETKQNQNELSSFFKRQELSAKKRNRNILALSLLQTVIIIGALVFYIF
ncbi:hypothetical protein ABLO26_24550 [Neobacillus sp. 179-J 1A1 HS]|uniref:hypothetical protein n=1 Tax=Neobacillus driksii TaxID=3035913 RepID=UPI0035BBFBC5